MTKTITIAAVSLALLATLGACSQQGMPTATPRPASSEMAYDEADQAYAVYERAQIEEMMENRRAGCERRSTPTWTPRNCP